MVSAVPVASAHARGLRRLASVSIETTVVAGEKPELLATAAAAAAVMRVVVEEDFPRAV